MRIGTKFPAILIALWSVTAFVFVLQKTMEEGKKTEKSVSALKKFDAPQAFVPDATCEDLEDDSMENKARLNMFSVKNALVERLSSADPGNIRISGLEKTKLWNSRILEPYIRIEEYGGLKDTSIRINEREIVSPDLMIVEKYKSPVDGNEYPLSVVVLWNKLTSERATPEYWMPEDTAAAKYARGNPDGSVSLFVCPVEESEDVWEMRTASTNGELLSVSMTFRTDNAYKIKKIIGEIGDLCGLGEPLQTGRWFWRKNGGIPDSEMKRLKDFIDGGLIQWREISEWNGLPVVNGNAVTWNGVLLSLQLIVGKENSEDILKILEPVSKNDGFSFDVDDEGRIVKILVTDRFVLNFSSLWGL